MQNPMPAIVSLFIGLLATTLPVAGMEADDAPEEVELSLMSELYTAVLFDHALHTDIATCDRCHHHVTGTSQQNPHCGQCHDGVEEGETVVCSDCHHSDPFRTPVQTEAAPSDRYHLNVPGLKGAYHLVCIDCHHEMGGPIGCSECHTLTEAGERRFAVEEDKPEPVAQRRITMLPASVSANPQP